jgi:hypothetical protein
MIDLLFVAAFTVHLIAVNIAASGPLLCVALEWWAARRNDPMIFASGRRLAAASLIGFAIGVVIGGVLLAILWYAESDYWSALRRVPTYRWWFFSGELVFYLVCMVAYVWLWSGSVGTHVDASLRDAGASLRHGESSIGETRPRGRWWHRLLAILASTNVLYHFPPFFTMLSLMSMRPELQAASLDRSLYVELFTDAETLARVTHHWLSSVTTSAVALMLLASRHSAVPPPGKHDVSSTTFAACIALFATILQLPVGMWLLFVSPTSAQSQLLGGDATSTVLFVTAILSMVLLMQHLAAVALGDTSKSATLKSALFLLIVLLLMSGVLHRARIRPGAAILSRFEIANPRPILRAQRKQPSDFPPFFAFSSPHD